MSIASGERTFLVFYKFVAAAEASVRKKLCLTNNLVDFNRLLKGEKGC